MHFGHNETVHDRCDTHRNSTWAICQVTSAQVPMCLCNDKAGSLFLVIR